MLKNVKNLAQKMQIYHLLDALFIIIAFAFAVYLKYAFVDTSDVLTYYFFNGERILTTNDAYHYATVTRDLVEGNYDSGQEFFPAVEFGLPSMFSAAMAKILPITLDKMFFYMPIILGSLIVIPVFLLAKEVSNAFVAFFAALLASSTQAYANRTMGGYYDTDMLILTLPLFAAYFLIRILRENSARDVVLCVIFCILSFWWHKVSGIYLLGFCVFCAICYAFLARKDGKVFESLGVLLICISSINIALKLALIALFLHFSFEKVYIFKNLTAKIKSKFTHKSAVIFLLCVACALLANADLIIGRFAMYVARGNSDFSQLAIVRGVVDTIQELQPLPFEKVVERTMGDYYTFALGVLGTLLLLFKHPRTIVLAPFIILGIASLALGVRFSMFAAPIFSIGFFYLLHSATKLLPRIFDDKIVIDGVKIIAFAALGYFVIAPNYYHSKNIGYAPTLYTDELGALNAIKADSKSRDNVTISWWDYGFLTTYYTNTRSIISGVDLDGIKHYIMSRAITMDEKSAYNLMRIATNLHYDADSSLANLNLMDKILTHYNVKNPNEFFANLADFSEPIALNRDIYLYIPYSLFELGATIEQFSDIDLRDGSATYTDAKLIELKPEGFESFSYTLENKKHGWAVKFSTVTGKITDLESGRSLQAQKFCSTERRHSLLRSHCTKYNDNKSDLIVVNSSELGKFYIIDERTHNSLLVQFFLYENYDRSLFAMLYTEPKSKAWKLVR